MLSFIQADQPDKFAGPQWIITPLADQKFLLLMTGTVIVELWCRQISGWRQESVRISPSFRAPFRHAGNDLENNIVVFQVEQYTTFGSLGSIYDRFHSVDAGFAVEEFQPFFSDGDRGIAAEGAPAGIELSLALQDQDAVIYRVGYQLSAVGRFEVTPRPPIG